MKKSILLSVIIVLLLCSSIALAVDWSPQGDINLKNRYDIKNWNVTTCGADEAVVGILANGSWNCSSVFTGDITGINTNGEYLEGGCASGTCSLTVNQSNLNDTMDARDTDTWWNLSTSTYLYNNSNNLNINESKLNATMDARDDDTTYDNSSPITLSGTTFGLMSCSDTYILKYNNSASAWECEADVDTDTNTWWGLNEKYIYNNSNSLDFNETKLNVTINALDDDTTYTAGNYLYLSSTEFNVNETDLNATIEALDDDTTYTNGSGLGLSGTTFSHLDTSSQASSDNSGRTYIQDIVLDTFGHITSIVTGTETVTDSIWAITGPYIYNNSGSLDINETKLNATISALDTDTTIGNCSTTNSCGDILYESELDAISELNTQIADATVLISGGTLTNAKWCVYDGTGIDCNVEPVSDTDTQDLAYNTTTNVISLVDGGTINISEVDTDTDTTIGNCSVDQSCSTILYDTNATNFAAPGNCSSGDFVVNITATGVECATPSGSGDITNVQGDDIYIYNGSDSGEVFLIFNETKLNATIDAKIGAGDGQGINDSATDYLYDDGSTVSFNESKLNATIGILDTDTDTQDLAYNTTTNVISLTDGGTINISEVDTDTDTTIGNCSVDQSCSTILYDTNASDFTYTNGSGITLVDNEVNHSDTSSQASSDNSARTYIQDIVLDTFGHITSIVTAAETVVNSFWNITGSNYLYNNSGILDINQTLLNATISALDTDTTIGNCSVDQSCVNILYDTNATDFQIDLTDEASLYTALSDVTEFLETSDAATLATLDTGFGANELYDMNQHVLNTSDVKFNNVTVTDCIIFTSGGMICTG